MLGERIAELRKNKGLSQEELADILLTSRQAISKWERGESDPDIGRLKDLAVYFDVSIDYLLDYDIQATSANNVIDRIKGYFENGECDISLDEVKMAVSRNKNNLNLLLAVTSFVRNLYLKDRDEELLDLLVQYAKRAIAIFRPDNVFDANINDLHHMIASVYFQRGEYELAKAYLKENQVLESEKLIAQCELALGRYDEAEKLTSGDFLKSIGSLIENTCIQALIFLRTNRVKEALDLSEWAIGLIESVSKNADDFLIVVFNFAFIKACCEKALGLDYADSLSFLKENRDKTSGFATVNDGFRFYNNESVIFVSESGDIKDDFRKELNELKKRNVRGYQSAFDLFSELYGEEP